MPPWRCWVMCTTRWPPSAAHHFATMTSRVAPRPAVSRHAACHSVTRIASVSMYASAALSATPWNVESGRPNCWRCEVYSDASGRFDITQRLARSTGKREVGDTRPVGGLRDRPLDAGAGRVDEEHADIVATDRRRYQHPGGDVGRGHARLHAVEAPTVTVARRGHGGSERVVGAGLGQGGGED